MVRHGCTFLMSRTFAFLSPNYLKQTPLSKFLRYKSKLFLMLRKHTVCMLHLFCLTEHLNLSHCNKCNVEFSVKRKTPRKNMSFENMTSAELELSYYISTGEFQCDGSSSSVIEEQKTSLYLRQLRYEEFISDGLHKKREYMQGAAGKLCFKVMSYNVLSQQLLDQHRYLYRNQSPEVLRWEYRFPRLFAEIKAEDPDILCLQEVQESHIQPFYSQLEEMGYTGVFKKRTGGKVDGCAVYYRTCLFDLIDWTSVEYFQPRVSVLNRDNVGLILRLKVGSGHLVVATTHLLYNPRRHDVRLAQMQLFLAEVHRLAKIDDEEAGVILTGDLNSRPNSPVVRLLNEGNIAHSFKPLPSHLGILPTCIHASSPQLFNSEKGGSRSPSPSLTEVDSKNSPSRSPTEPNVENLSLSHEFNFHSVYPISQAEESVATTYQDAWVNVDYMFYSCCDKLELISRLRLPQVDECSRFIRELPNYASPSDHLPLSATFALSV